MAYFASVDINFAIQHGADAACLLALLQGHSAYAYDCTTEAEDEALHSVISKLRTGIPVCEKLGVLSVYTDVDKPTYIGWTIHSDKMHDLGMLRSWEWSRAVTELLRDEWPSARQGSLIEAQHLVDDILHKDKLPSAELLRAAAAYIADTDETYVRRLDNWLKAKQYA